LTIPFSFSQFNVSPTGDDRTQDCENLRDALPAVILDSLDAGEAHAALEHVAICGECHDTIQQDAELVSKILLSDVDLETEVPTGIKQIWACLQHPASR
jgi:hypothetical protein